MMRAQREPVEGTSDPMSPRAPSARAAASRFGGHAQLVGQARGLATRLQAAEKEVRPLGELAHGDERCRTEND